MRLGHTTTAAAGAPDGGGGGADDGAARVAGALLLAVQAADPRWLRHSARRLEERVAPRHPDLPFLVRLAAHLRHVAGLAEAALEGVWSRGAAGGGRAAARRGPRPRGRRRRLPSRG
jgi:hypothetical protein